MERQPAANQSRKSLVRSWPWWVVLLVLLFVGFIRFRLLDMPLERDEGEYAYAGQLILQGIPPYELAYNMKLPGTYFVHAIGMAVFGQTAAGVHATLLVANSLTIVFVFLLGRQLFGVTAGLVACASHGVLSVSPAVLGMAAHANHFVILFAVPAVLLLWRAGESNRLKTLFSSGLLFGLAFLMKQQGVFFCLFGWLILVWWQLRRNSGVRPGFGTQSLAFGLGMVLPFGLTCLVLAWAGVFGRFWFWTFTYASAYATENTWKDGAQILWAYLVATHRLYLGFGLLAVAGLVAAMFVKSLRKPFLFTLMFLAFSFLAAATGFYFRRHYFILLLPAFALAVGMTVSLFQFVLQAKMGKAASAILLLIVFGAVLGANIFAQRSLLFEVSGDQVSRLIYAGYPFLEARSVAAFIRERSNSAARIAVVGSEPEIYFYARRHSATGYIYTYALMEPQPAAFQMQNEMIREIETSRPEYLVWVGFDNSWLARPSSPRAIFDWFNVYAANVYQPVGLAHTDAGGRTVYLWGDDARNYQGPLDESLVVYQRKPDHEPAPARSH
jgi:4-amino-4-deoxy-L-arabinose transferase-like glycosyltransferase